MKLITITQPAFFEGEAEAITSLFDAGLEILHLRKPGASYEDMEQLLNRLPPEYLKRIVTHEHFQLASFRNLKGIHLNGRNPAAPAGFTGHVSRSCHSLEEVAKYKATCDYVFLSPIYDSISKEGYPSAYTTDSLQKARQAGIIDAKVMALGGVTAAHFPEISSLASAVRSFWEIYGNGRERILSGISRNCSVRRLYFNHQTFYYHVDYSGHSHHCRLRLLRRCRHTSGY